MNLKKFISGLVYRPLSDCRPLRTSGACRAACAGDPSDWERAEALLWVSEETLLKAHEIGDLPPGGLEYCQGIIELTIQGKRVAKTRMQWARYLIGFDDGPPGKVIGCPCPYRYDDSDMTKSMKLYTALLQLEPFNKAHPEATLDELVEKINRGLWGL